jgi:hypothetical protein
VPLLAAPHSAPPGSRGGQLRRAREVAYTQCNDDDKMRVSAAIVTRYMRDRDPSVHRYLVQKEEAKRKNSDIK